MAVHTHTVDPEGETSERGGLLEEIEIEERPAIRRRLEAFDIDEDTRRRWKVLVVPAMCLFFGFIFGISAGVLLAGGEGGGGNCSTPSPSFEPNIPVKFEPNITFANASAVDEATDAAWAALNPIGRGFVHIDETGQPIPFNGTHPTSSHTKVVSVFHQLHCLNHLRRSLAASAANPLEYSYLVPQLSHHWGHCFDFLRQSLMCAADITLENLQESKDGHASLASVDGWGTTHQCRDYDAVKQWAEDHRASDDGGIE